MHPRLPEPCSFEYLSPREVVRSRPGNDLVNAAIALGTDLILIERTPLRAGRIHPRMPLSMSVAHYNTILYFRGLLQPALGGHRADAQVLMRG